MTAKRERISELLTHGSKGSTSGLAGLAGRVQTARKLLLLQKHVKARLDLLVDIHGHQILVDGVFNGDPHPGE